MTFRRLSLALLLCAPALYAQSYTESNLYSFSQTPAYDPLYGVIQASDGNFYGPTEQSGTENDVGADFKLTPAGTLTNLHFFCQNSSYCTDGLNSFGLVEGPDGNFYSTTLDGGADTQGSGNYGGTVYKLTPSGTFTILYNFCNVAQCADGAFPGGNVIFGTDGNLYGVAGEGGAFGYGSIFKISTSGTLTTLYSFCPDVGTCAAAYAPSSALVQASNGNFYGIAARGGPNGYGGIFEITLGGAYTLAASFPALTYSTCGDDSLCPALVEAPDGNLYGTMSLNGGNNEGQVFKFANGAITTLYSFCSKGTAPGCLDGENPQAPLLVGTDGNFYGTTTEGGSAGALGGAGGSVFQLTLGGKLTSLYSACVNNTDSCTDADGPGPILQGNDGNFYGTSSNGGANNFFGTVFALKSSTPLAAPVQVKLSSSTAAAGSAVTLTYKILAAWSLTQQQCFAYLAAGSTFTPLGRVSPTFSDGAASGTMSVTAPAAAGSYTYGLTCGGTQSGTANLTVTGSSKAGTTATFAATPNPASVGQNVTLTATVKRSSGTGTPGGTVTFAYGSDVLGSAALNGSGVAAVTGSSAGLPPGSYSVSATYSGDANDNGSSATTAIVLKQDATATTLTASPNPVTRPASVTLTATVKRSGVSGTPTGSVTFYVESLALGTANLNGSGVATLSASTSGQAAGNYPVTAKYNGDTNDASSTSAATTVAVH